MAKATGLTAPELEELEILRSQLRKLLRALDEIKDRKTLALVTSGKEFLAKGQAGIPVAELWKKLGLK